MKDREILLGVLQDAETEISVINRNINRSKGRKVKQLLHEKRILKQVQRDTREKLGLFKDAESQMKHWEGELWHTHSLRKISEVLSMMSVVAPAYTSRLSKKILERASVKCPVENRWARAERRRHWRRTKTAPPVFTRRKMLMEILREEAKANLKKEEETEQHKPLTFRVGDVCPELSRIKIA